MEEHATATVRTASGELARLLRRRGVTREVGKAMRRALQKLDEILDGRGTESGVRSAITELRGCLQLIQDSTNSADHQLTDGVAAALSCLFPLESTEMPADAPDTGAAASASSEPLVPPIEQSLPALRVSPEAAAARDVATDAAIARMVRNLPRLHARRLACIDDPAATLGDLKAVEMAIEQAKLTLSWSGSRAKQVLQRSVEGTVPRRDLAANVLGLLHVDLDVDPVFLTDLVRKAPADPTMLRTIVDGLRICAGQAVAERVRAIFGALNSATRAAVVPWLVEERKVSWEGLLDLSEDRSDEVATAAISLLAWCPLRGMRAAVFERALTMHSEVRAEPLLFAATALGEQDALLEIRRRADLGSGGQAIIDALAVAGEESDVSRLLAIFRRGGRPAGDALLAAAHLGSVLVLPAIDSDKDGSGIVFRDHARRAILGDGSSPTDRQHPRLIRGKPWSVPAAVAGLAAPGDMPLRLLRWAALELAARTGEPAPCAVDLGAAAARLVAATGAFVASFRTVERAGIGRWLYGGRPASGSRDQAPLAQT
jgi:hypothetical protein